MDAIRSWVEQHFTVERWRGAEADVRCRLHDDAHASASINVERRAWKCQGCGAGGKLSDLAQQLGLEDLPPFSGNGSGKRREVARYDYRDAQGRLLYQVVRFQPKDFRQFNPATEKWSIKGLERVPYRLPDLLAGIKAGHVVWVIEGEKDCERLARLGLVATCNQGGVGSARLWRGFAQKYFPAGSRVVLVPDADLPGHELMQEVGGCLAAAGCKVKVLDLGYPTATKHGKDVSDWLAEGHSKQQLVELAKSAPAFIASKEKDSQAEVEKRPKQADIGIRIGEGCELFHDGDETFARMQLNGHREVWPLRGREFRTWLRRQFYTRTATALSSAALDDALGVLEGKALFEGPEIKTAVRLSGDDSCIYLDLANKDWQVVQITAAGWQVLAEAPVCFRRPPGNAALPIPQSGGRPDAHLGAFLNMNADDQKLFTACLVNALRPRGPYPILCLHGEQGSAKSTAARVFRACVDPNTAMLRSAPREERDLVVSANNSWVIAYDNLSHLPTWVSDALCRIATGSGFGARALYTNREECLLQAQRPIQAVPQPASRCPLSWLKSTSA